MVLSKSHSFIAGLTHGFAISPLLQSHMLEFSVDLPFERGASLLNTALPQAKVGSSQSQRLTHYFGGLDQTAVLLETPGFKIEPVKEADTTKILYVEVDGGHLRTDDGYRETKVGRIFAGEHLEKKSCDNEDVQIRMKLSSSDYMAHLGSHSEFTPKFDKLIHNHLSQHPGLRTVFLSDGAEWIGNWIANYPEATPILDFFHAAEHLADFAKLAFGTQSQMGSHWIDSRLKELKEGQLSQVISNIGNMRQNLPRDMVKDANRLIRYYFKNRYRMKYDQYRRDGLCIGSGAIESAISTLVQQRCKLVGQRWTDRVSLSPKTRQETKAV